MIDLLHHLNVEYTELKYQANDALVIDKDDNESDVTLMVETDPDIVDYIDRDYFINNNRNGPSYPKINITKLKENVNQIEYHSQQIQHHTPSLKPNECNCRSYKIIHGYLKYHINNFKNISYKDIYFIIEQYLNICNYSYHIHQMRLQTREIFIKQHINDFVKKHQCHCLFAYYINTSLLIKFKMTLENTPFIFPKSILDKPDKDLDYDLKFLRYYHWLLWGLENRDTVNECHQQSRDYLLYLNGVRLVRSETKHPKYPRKCKLFCCCCIYVCIIVTIVAISISLSV